MTEQQTKTETKPQNNNKVLTYNIDDNQAKRLFKNFLNNEKVLNDFLVNKTLVVGKTKDGQPIKAIIKNPVLS